MTDKIHTARRYLGLILLVLCGMSMSGCVWRFPWEIRHLFHRREAAAPRKSGITMRGLLDEMPDLDRLSEFPDPPYTNKQASSYDRRAESPDKAWFANGDAGQYIRTEDHGDRKEYVMMDAEGPGAIVRIWSANPDGTIRFYMNGSDEPVFALPMKELLGAKHPLFPEPYSGVKSAGWNFYFPIPYSGRMKVTSDKGHFYYHVNYRTYPAGTKVEDFSLAGAEAIKDEIQAVIPRLQGRDRPAETLRGHSHSAIAPGEKKLIFSVQGEAQGVDMMRIHVDAQDMNGALRGMLLLAYFDDDPAPAILSPLGDFFGASPGVNPYQALPMGVLADGTMYSRWVMPIKQHANFYLVNYSGAPARLASQFDVKPLKRGWTDRTMHFHAGYRAEWQMKTRPFRDWNFVTVKGRGMFVGDALAVVNPVKAWWGEGDEKIYVDGENFPSHFGTGTEDYYGYAWCSPVKFYHPYHNQPRCDGPGNYGYTSVNRFHIFDSIPFTQDFKFDMEVWHQAPNVKVDYAAVSYWYAQPGAASDIRVPTAELLKVPALAARDVYKAEGAIEAEKLDYALKGGKAEKQELSGGGKWSGETQVWFTEGKPGDSIEFKFDAPAEKEYEVVAQFTKAPDYGIANITVNGKTAQEGMDFYDTDVKPSGEISLGVHKLTVTGNSVKLEVTGANENARKSYMLGVDYFKLKPVK